MGHELLQVLLIENDAATPAWHDRLHEAGVAWCAPMCLATVATALGWLKEQRRAGGRCDAIVLDLGLPGGVENVRRLRHAAPATPLVALAQTGGDAVRAMELGASDAVVREDAARLPRAVATVARLHALHATEQAEARLRHSETQLAEAQQLAHLGNFEWDKAANRVTGSQELHRIFGLPAEASGTIKREDLLERVHPDDLAFVQGMMEQTLRDHQPFAYHFRIVRPDGTRRIVHARGLVATDESGQVARLFGTVQDVTESWREEEAQRLLAEASAVLASSLDYATTLQSVARLAVPRLADMCVVNLVDDDGGICRVASAHVDPAQEALLLELEQGYAPDPAGPGLVPTVLRTGKPLLVEEIEAWRLENAARDARQLEVLHALKSGSAMGVPLIAAGRLLGAMVLVALASKRRYDANDLALAEELARRAALAVDNARLYREAQAAQAEAERARVRLELLAEASSVLASSLDYDTTLAAVARLAVPQLAEWCIVDLLEERDMVRRVVVAHADPACAELARELIEFPPDLQRAEGVPRVLRTGRSDLVPEFDDARLQALARSDEHLRLLRALPLKSHVCVPLLAHGRILGALTFSASCPQRYGPGDLALAEDLARRAALAVDNARLYRQAQEINRAKDDFLATLSHELRTPLTAILGWISLLRQGGLPPTMFKEATATIEQAAHAQAQLIDDILDVSRIIQGKMRLKMEPVELAPLLRVVAEAVRPATEAKSIQLYLALCSNPCRVLADPDRLQQVVWNLLSNAVKFTPRGGAITLRLESLASGAALNHLAHRDHLDHGATRNETRSETALARVTVSDTGRGINRDFLPYVFDSFRQADSSSTRKHGGLGLGLAIVRHLMEMHGGTVQADSPGTGQGATFWVELPLLPDLEEVYGPVAPVAVMPEPGGVSAGEAEILSGVRVLVVDDDRRTLRMLAAALARHGAEVRDAISATVALAVLDEWRPDVLITDIAMPDEDGYDLLRQVRAREGDGGHLPAIALTAYAREEDRQRALAAGFQRHLPKPVKPSDLAALVAQLAEVEPGA